MKGPNLVVVMVLMSHEPSGSGLEKFNNVWYMYCNKGCGWNCTHTSSFHSTFTSNWSSVPSALPATQPYHQKIAKEERKGLPSTFPNIPLVNHHSTVLSSNGLVILDKNKLLTVCEHHEHAVTHPTVAAFLSDLKKMLN
jgi:hypothetical protein